MHEMSLAAEIVRMVAERAAAEGARRIVRVGLAVGQIGHVEPQALAFCLDSAAHGTLAEGAAFTLDLKPGQAFCFDCGRAQQITARTDPCPECGGSTLHIAGGAELRVTEMEIE